MTIRHFCLFEASTLLELSKLDLTMGMLNVGLCFHLTFFISVVPLLLYECRGIAMILCIYRFMIICLYRMLNFICKC